MVAREVSSPVSFELTGALARDEAAQTTIRDHFDRALTVHPAHIPPDGSSELAFVEAWKEVTAAMRAPRSRSPGPAAAARLFFRGDRA